MTRRQMASELIRRTDGLIKLRPEFVHRFYPDLNRLGQARFKRSNRQFIPERWIGSSVQADNPRSMPGGGLSMLADSREPIALRDAIKTAPEAMLGAELASAHGAEFRVLVKILDPAEPIIFHLHATDAQVRRTPRRFPGYHFGKDEAYYFLEAPKGPVPYTHVGLHEGVTRRALIDATRRRPEHVLELSPSFYQEFETGFFVPAGVPHRPGTALTLEIQQPSDVSTRLHPSTSDDDFQLIDMRVSRLAGASVTSRMVPQIESKTDVGEIATIFPAQTCRKFAGKRIRVNGRFAYRECSPIVVLIWNGRGRINGRRVKRSDEFFIPFDAAARGIEIENEGDELLEIFTFYPVH